MKHNQKTLTLEQIAERIEEVGAQVRIAIEKMGERPAAAYAALEPVAVNVLEAARLLSVHRDEIYRMHADGDLNGFRTHRGGHLKFLVTEVREVASKMSRERRHANGRSGLRG